MSLSFSCSQLYFDDDNLLGRERTRKRDELFCFPTTLWEERVSLDIRVVSQVHAFI